MVNENQLETSDVVYLYRPAVAHRIRALWLTTIARLPENSPQAANPYQHIPPDIKSFQYIQLHGY